MAHEQDPQALDDELLLDAELPDEIDPRVKQLPLPRQEIWLQAFNDAMAEENDRKKAEAIAWAEATAAKSDYFS